MSFNWTCPYCNVKTTIVASKTTLTESKIYTQNKDGAKILDTRWIICPNSECDRLALYVELYDFSVADGQWARGSRLDSWRLMPGTSAKIYPEYIPKQILQDYNEAYAVATLSPKASATLSRRCLQGIIRDFWGVKKARLVDEIAAIEDRIDPLIWNGIEAIRKVGNIGAHMEKDINIIVDVDPEEAQLLLQLIELLFEEWYVHRYERQKKLELITEIATNKENDKKTNGQ